MPVELATILFSQATVFTQLFHVRDLLVLGDTGVGPYLFTTWLLRRLLERRWALSDVVADARLRA